MKRGCGSLIFNKHVLQTLVCVWGRVDSLCAILIAFPPPHLVEIELAPVWTPDKDAVLCMNCSKVKFSALYRKVCGGILIYFNCIAGGDIMNAHILWWIHLIFYVFISLSAHPHTNLSCSVSQASLSKLWKCGVRGMFTKQTTAAAAK